MMNHWTGLSDIKPQKLYTYRKPEPHTIISILKCCPKWLRKDDYEKTEYLLQRIKGKRRKGI